MFGKVFESLYTGSMVGKGALMFAVWGYVIAHQKPDKEVGSQVELNPKLLGFIFGEEEGEVSKTIEELCGEDPESRSPERGGRRLVRLGQYAYQVVNGEKYRAMRDEDERRRQNREAQARHRQKVRVKGGGVTAAERQREKAVKEGDVKTVAAIDRLEGVTLPPQEGLERLGGSGPGNGRGSPGGRSSRGDSGGGEGPSGVHPCPEEAGPSGDSPACEEIDGGGEEPEFPEV